MKYGVDRIYDRDRSSVAAVASGSAGASMMPVVKGSMMVLNQLSNLETTVGRFYINLPNRMIDLARFSLPYADPMGDGEWFSVLDKYKVTFRCLAQTAKVLTPNTFRSIE